MATTQTGLDHHQLWHLPRLWLNLIRAHDQIFSENNKAALKRLAIKVSIAGFAIHLGMVFLSRWLSHPPLIISAVGQNYLSAIATPFNFILFYEVLTLIAALPASTTQSIANQFELYRLFLFEMSSKTSLLQAKLAGITNTFVKRYLCSWICALAC